MESDELLAEVIYHCVEEDLLEEAEKYSRRWTQDSPFTAEAWLCLAMTLFNKGAGRETIDVLERVATLDPENVDMRMYRVLALQLENESAQALSEIEVLVREFPDNEEFVAIRTSLLLAREENWTIVRSMISGNQISKPHKIHLALQFADSLLVAGRADEAIEVFRFLVNLDPYSKVVWFRLATTYISLNALNDGLQCFEILYAIDPHNSEAAYGRGIVLLALDRYKEAHEFLSDVINEFQDNSEIYTLWIKSTLSTGDIQAAIEAIKSAPPGLDLDKDEVISDLMKQIDDYTRKN